MLFNVIAIPGSGKTLFSTVYARWYSESYPSHKIYANYHLNLPNFIFSEYMFLPFTTLSNCLIIVDDIYAIKNMSTLLSVCANIHRKADVTMIICAQYYTMILKDIRDLSIRITPWLESDTLFFNSVSPVIAELGLSRNELKRRGLEQKVLHVFDYVRNLYDTNEIVAIATETKIIQEIVRFSLTDDDIELNVSLFTKNQSERRRFMKQLNKYIEENPSIVQRLRDSSPLRQNA